MTSHQAAIVLRHAEQLTGRGLDKACFVAIVSTLIDAAEARYGPRLDAVDKKLAKLEALEKKLAQLQWRQRGRRHAAARKPSGRGAGRGA